MKKNKHIVHYRFGEFISKYCYKTNRKIQTMGLGRKYSDASCSPNTNKEITRSNGFQFNIIRDGYVIWTEK